MINKLTLAVNHRRLTCFTTWQVLFLVTWAMKIRAPARPDHGRLSVSAACHQRQADYHEATSLPTGAWSEFPPASLGLDHETVINWMNASGRTSVLDSAHTIWVMTTRSGNRDYVNVVTDLMTQDGTLALHEIIAIIENNMNVTYNLNDSERRAVDLLKVQLARDVSFQSRAFWLFGWVHRYIYIWVYMRIVIDRFKDPY